jgi:hypothetical protein
LAVESGLAGGVTFGFPPFASGFEFTVTGVVDRLGTPGEHVLGDERTRAEFAALLDEAGFALAEVIITGSTVDVVEARPV